MALDAKIVAIFRALGFDERIGWISPLPGQTTEHFRCEFCSAENLDCTLIEHDKDCPVSMIRKAMEES